MYIEIVDSTQDPYDADLVRSVLYEDFGHNSISRAIMATGYTSSGQVIGLYFSDQEYEFVLSTGQGAHYTSHVSLLTVTDVVESLIL